VVGGQTVELRDAHRATRLGLAFVHQDPTNVDDLSVCENVLLGLGYPRRLGLLLDRAELARRSAKALRRLGGDIDPGTPVGKWSLAHKRLLCIARALVFDARLIVLDEPTASLTHAEIDHLHQVL